METVSCNLCGNDSPTPVMLAEDVNHRTPGTFALGRCRKCGLVYMNPRPTSSEIGRYYPPVYDEHTASTLPNRFSIAEAQIVTHYVPGPGNILDIGCAAGYFLRTMREMGWEVSGVEPDADAAARAAGVEGAVVKRRALGPGEFGSGSFDVITLWSVLEHLHDPLGTLRLAADLLKPDGCMFIEVPNFASLERLLFQGKWFGLDLPRHLYHFTPTTLTRLLSKAGFRVRVLRHVSGHDSFRSSVRARLRSASWSAARGAAPGNPPGMETRNGKRSSFRRLLNGTAVGGITRAADRLGMGSQILAVASKVPPEVP